MLTQQKTTKLYQIFQVCTQCCNLRNSIRYCPSSGLNTLFIRLDSVVFSLQSDHINLSYQGGCRKEDNNQQRKPTRSTCHQYQQKLQNHPQQLSTLFRYFQKLAEQANLTYVNIVEDIGAAAAELKVVWNRPEEFGNVITHPGDFHIMKKNFQVNMDSYVFSSIHFLFKRCQIQYSFLILRSWVCQS